MTDDWDRDERAWREEQRLTRAYHQAVGECLQYGILVYHTPGGSAKSLGELQDALAEYHHGPGAKSMLTHVTEAYLRSSERGTR
jgi:hypothetical protein